MSDPIVIVAAARSVEQSSLSAAQLASAAIAAAVKVVKAFYHRMLHNTRELVSTALIL